MGAVNLQAVKIEGPKRLQLLAGMFLSFNVPLFYYVLLTLNRSPLPVIGIKVVYSYILLRIHYVHKHAPPVLYTAIN